MQFIDQPFLKSIAAYNATVRNNDGIRDISESLGSLLQC